MRYRPLGRTGLQVSAVAVGTVSLGLAQYGIEAPGEFGRPDAADVVRLLRRAADAGVNLFDTAPAYGESERLLGDALGHDARCLFATKIPAEYNALGGPALRRGVADSLEASRRAFRREVVDVIQIYNPSAETIGGHELSDVLLDARARGIVRVIAASVYGEESALAAVRAGCFDMIQIAYSVLDQRPAVRVFGEAHAAGVGILVRSALLKGALTAKAQWLADELRDVRRAAERARDTLAGGSWDALPAAALRFCLSATQVSSVLVGIRTELELEQAIAAEAAGPLEGSVLRQAAALALEDERLVNPSHWPVA